MARSVATVISVSPDLEPLLDAHEAMAILGCGRTFLTEHRAELGGVKVGSRLKFRRSGLTAYLDRQQLQEPELGVAPAPTPISAARQYGHGPINPIDGRPW